MGAGRRRWLAAASSVGLLVPATAQAGEIVVPACSKAIPGVRTIQVTGTGFPPDEVVSLDADGELFGRTVADATGTFRDALLAPPFSSPRRMIQTFELSAFDADGRTATTRLRVTRIDAVLPRRARPASEVRMRVYGFEVGRAVYLHVRRGGRTRGSFLVGRAAAPCGTASRRLRYMPLRRWRSGTYTYAFQQSRRFRDDLLSVQQPVSVIRNPARG
jgi:hypothetical protein